MGVAPIGLPETPGAEGYPRGEDRVCDEGVRKEESWGFFRGISALRSAGRVRGLGLHHASYLHSEVEIGHRSILVLNGRNN